jgi:DnaJ-class molecular chaperone
MINHFKSALCIIILIILNHNNNILLCVCDYYNILGVSRSCSSNEIQSSYRKLSKIFHPDKNQNNPQAQEKFVQISTAYQVLIDPEKRKVYDKVR